MSLIDLQHDLNQLAEQYLDGAPRAANRLWIGSDFIAVRKHDDRSLQYYGGFEYVDKEHRTECGEYVFYSTEDDRVQGHHECFEQEN